MHPKLAEMVEILDLIMVEKIDQQSPLMLQTIWRTKGNALILDDNCFDLFVWSDFCFTKLFTQQALIRSRNNISRHGRSVFWIIKMLYEFTTIGKFDANHILSSMVYLGKNDKAFAVGGRTTQPLMACKELITPRIKKESRKEIILGNGQELFQPERRLDAAIINTPGLF